MTPYGLKYREDLGLTFERFRAFWEGEVIDRVALAVTAPREVPAPNLDAPGDEQLLKSLDYIDEPFLGDIDTIVRSANAQLASKYFAGEALPFGYAPGNLLYAAYGGRGAFTGETIWVDPTIRSGQQWEEYRFDPHNPFIEHVLRITRALAEDARGKYLVSSPGVFGPLDAMSLIRGMADFVVEMALGECEPAMRKAHRACLDGFKHISEAIYAAADNGQPGYVNHPGLWAPGRINNWSADWSCLIGPKEFRAWMMPELEEMARFLEFNMYHLDGPNAVRHLPMILEIDALRGIQYTLGAGHTHAEALPVYQQIQQAGRVQWIWCGYEDVEWLLHELDPRGLLIFTRAPTVEAADALLKKAGRWSTRAHRAAG
jgi:hypothetical protein